MQAEPHTAAAGRPRLDVVALHRMQRRIDAAPQPPWLHAEAARRMAERLSLIKLQPSRVLDWSGPAGSSSDLLQQAYPKAVQQALRDGPVVQEPRRWWQRRPVGPQTVATHDLPPGCCELLWSNMRLHATAEPQTMFAHWHRALAVGGFLMFSTFGPGTLVELRDLYRARSWGEPFAPLVDMHDLGDMLVQAGFADPVMDQETLTLTWPDPDALLRELRSIGANASLDRHAGLRTPRWRRRLEDALRDLTDDGRPALSFELVYGHAFRAAPRARVQAQTNVPLDYVRAMIRASKP